MRTDKKDKKSTFSTKEDDRIRTDTRKVHTLVKRLKEKKISVLGFGVPTTPQYRGFFESITTNVGIIEVNREILSNTRAAFTELDITVVDEKPYEYKTEDIEVCRFLIKI